MGKAIQMLVQQFTGKASLTDCTVEELQQLVNRYPYFAPSHFALLQKLHEIGDEAAYTRQYQKALLYHSDPLKFHHFVRAYSYQLENVPIEPVFDTELSPAEHDETKPEETSSFDKLERETYTDLSFASEPVIVQSFVEEGKKEEKAPEDSSVSEHTGDNTIQPEALNIEAALINAPLPPLPDPAAPSPASTTGLTFEPYHTVDYFASQGIKVTAEDLSKDKLGKQLRSFTEWLKTMKRLPAATHTHDTERGAEQKVESLAGASVSESEVVTEAMAEVWTKQGAIEKASAIYEKLSLLYPDKAAYFAAKIQSLKQPV